MPAHAEDLAVELALPSAKMHIETLGQTLLENAVDKQCPFNGIGSWGSNVHTQTEHKLAQDTQMQAP